MSKATIDGLILGATVVLTEDKYNLNEEEKDYLIMMLTKYSETGGYEHDIRCIVEKGDSREDATIMALDRACDLCVQAIRERS